MSTRENSCLNLQCGWVEFSNDKYTTCPKCGAVVCSFSDEEGSLYEAKEKGK